MINLFLDSNLTFIELSYVFPIKHLFILIIICHLIENSFFKVICLAIII